MISLSGQKPFARGGRRECYQHPDDDSLCIKVCRSDKSPVSLRQADPWYKRLRSPDYYDENVKDLKLLTLLYQRIDPVFRIHLPELNNIQETDLGPGLITELVRNSNGSISSSAKQFIHEHGITPQLEEALDKLQKFIISQHIYLRDPFAHNLTAQELSSGKIHLKIIDGLGITKLQSFPWVFPKKQKKHFNKKFQRLLKDIKLTHQNRQNDIPKNTNGFFINQ